MLTKNDETIAQAHSVFRSVRSSMLTYVGFKDVGLPFEELRALTADIHASGKHAVLEVVSVEPAAELRSAAAAVDLGVDFLFGGRQAEAVAHLLAGTGIKYFPFAGKTVGHPTALIGTIDEIVEDARRLAQIDGVHGLDLLAYRYSGDAIALADAVVRAVDVPIVAAGSISDQTRLERISDCGIWGFTVGSAIFERQFIDDVSTQVERILRLSARANRVQ